MKLHIVASLVPWNSKAVGSPPDQPATFPETLLVRLLAVVVGLVLGLWGLVSFILAWFVDPYECVATIV